MTNRKLELKKMVISVFVKISYRISYSIVFYFFFFVHALQLELFVNKSSKKIENSRKKLNCRHIATRVKSFS